MKLTWRKWTRAPKSQQSGFALVVTLIILALAAVTVVAFLMTATTERANTASYARIEKAELFAEAGVDAAIARITTEMLYRPYHAIGYRSLSVGTAAKPLTEVIPVIVGPRTTDPAVATYNTAPVATSDVFLLSTPGATSSGPPGSLAPSGLDDTNSVNLNSNNLSTEPKGWIGSPVTAATPIPFRAPWIEVLKDPTQPAQPNPSTANYNPVIGRYAYWIEDETSKLDSSIVGNGGNPNDPKTAGAFKHGDGVNIPTNSPPRLAVDDLDVGGLPLANGAPLAVGDTITNSAILAAQSNQPMPDARFLNRVSGLASDVHETTKFYETSFSLSNDLAGTGRRRANINALVTNTNAAETIAANIDDIGYVITGTHLMDGTLAPVTAKANRVFNGAPMTTNALPTFGLRFFTSPTPSTDQQNMYIERIAANIRDYIDTDSLATYIDTGDTVISNVKPAFAWKSATEPRALGKEAVPLLQEIAWYGYQRKMQDDPGSSPRSRSYDVDIDFYFEFVNPTTKSFVAPSGSFLKVYNRVTWSAGSYPPVSPPDAEYDISGISFPAGQAIVLTTETDSSLDPPGLVQDTSKLTRLSGGVRNFTGHTDEKINNIPGLQMLGRAGSATRTTDYQAEAVWGTPTGVYDGIGYVSSGGDGTKTWNMDGNPAEIQNKTRFVYTYSLRGNDENSRTGDPRSLSEQISMTGGLASLGNDQTRFYGNILGTGVIPGNSTFGKAKMSFVDPTKWPDYTVAFDDQSRTAYAVNRDAAMQSIGELGNIYDPVRTIASKESNPGPIPSILRARGGGRTLKVGQIDDRISGGRFSSTWFNAAWRLTDLFSVELTKDASGNYIKVSSPTSRGKININGILRDSVDPTTGNVVRSGGLPFRAALRNVNFLTSPDGDPSLTGRALTNSEIDALVASAQDYLLSNGPMMERGEISQLSFFNTGTMASVDDRGREEIFRRMIEAITTRSASFTVYAIGQAVRQDKNGTETAESEKRLAMTFQLEPRKNGIALEKSAVPYDAVDSYAVKKVYAPH